MQRSPALWFRDNGLTLVLMGLFLVSAAGQALMGWNAENQERMRHAEAAISIAAYLGGGEFLSTLFENWESEFLQMSAYVVLTAYLFQRGSAESNDPDDRSPDPDEAWWRANRNRVGAWLYAHSLGLALFLLFLASFVLHWTNSARVAAEQAVRHGEPEPGVLGHLVSAELWFESFQNWQSEFLSTAVLVVLSIYLRQRGSPESKKVTARNSETGAA